MCEYCQLSGNELGKPFEIQPCANGDLRVRATYLNGGIILFRDLNDASGFFKINFCPICGRKIKEEI